MIPALGPKGFSEIEMFSGQEEVFNNFSLFNQELKVSFVQAEK
jgi:hypothetical protein